LGKNSRSGNRFVPGKIRRETVTVAAFHPDPGQTWRAGSGSERPKAGHHPGRKAAVVRRRKIAKESVNK